MRRRVLVAAGSLGLFNPGRTQEALPLIVVDETHIGFSRPDGSSPPPYVISPSLGVAVVTSPGYTFDLQSFGVSAPNAIHLIKGENQRYRSAWNGYERRHELTSSTLRSHAGSIPFRGFFRGETAIIAIGFDHTGITPGKDNVLSAMWLGMVKVA